MNPHVGLLFAAALSVTAASVYAAPGRLDSTKRSRVSTEQKADLPEQVDIKKNEVLQDRRFTNGEVREKETAVVGDRRSTIEVGETRDKRMVPTPELLEQEKIDRKESDWNRKPSKFSTGEDTYRTQVATRFQDKIGDASPFPAPNRTVADQRTTFSKVNRFSFRRNGDQSISVNAAGSEAAVGDVSDRSALSGSTSAPATPRGRDR